MAGLRLADFYGGTTAAGADGMSQTQEASGGEATFAGGLFPSIWVVGLIIALVLLRVAYEVAE